MGLTIGNCIKLCSNNHQRLLLMLSLQAKDSVICLKTTVHHSFAHFHGVRVHFQGSSGGKRDVNPTMTVKQNSNKAGVPLVVNFTWHFDNRFNIWAERSGPSPQSAFDLATLTCTQINKIWSATQNFLQFMVKNISYLMGEQSALKLLPLQIRTHPRDAF